jgi:hypothetical protein
MVDYKEMILRSQAIIEVVQVLVKEREKMVSRKPARNAWLAWPAWAAQAQRKINSFVKLCVFAPLRENNSGVQRLTLPMISCISQPQFEISPFREE